MLKARCSLMARLTQDSGGNIMIQHNYLLTWPSLPQEIKSVSLPGTLGQTFEFLRSYKEALHGNHRRSIKMLDSIVHVGSTRGWSRVINPGF